MMKRAQNTEWVDHCAANYVPHFDIDLDSTICLGIDGVGTVAAYEPMPCTPVGAKPEGGYVKGVGWLRGCDRNGFSVVLSNRGPGWICLSWSGRLSRDALWGRLGRVVLRRDHNSLALDCDPGCWCRCCDG